MNKSLLASGSVLLLSNLIALACAIWLRWNLFEIIVLYWIQSLIIGEFQRRKINDMVAYARHPSRSDWFRVHGTALMREDSSTGFVVIYGLFWAMEGVILLVKYIDSEHLTVNLIPVALTSATFFVAHWWSYRTNKSTDQRRVIDVKNTVLRPLFRMLLPLHIFSLTIDFDNSFSPIAITAWMLIKTVVDLGLHADEHGGNRLFPVA